MPSFNDPASRLNELVAKMEPRFRKRFLEVVASIKSQMDLESIARLLQNGQIEEALVTAEVAALRVSGVFNQGFILAGDDTAKYLSQALDVIVDFNHLNESALDVMTRNQLRLVTGFMDEQRKATHEALVDGVRRGLNPIEQARNFRESIGLTEYQQQIVNNYRRQLNTLDRGLFDRELRDRRFDSTVLRAIEENRNLSQVEIERMVQRYTERWIKYRSEVIARTESLSSVHAGSNESYKQAIASGDLDAEDLVQEWVTSGLPTVRDSHLSMEGQQRGIGEMFVSGLGNELEFPGDTRAPIEDTAQCACTVTVRYTASAKAKAKQDLITINNP